MFGINLRNSIRRKLLHVLHDNWSFKLDFKLLPLSVLCFHCCLSYRVQLRLLASRLTDLLMITHSINYIYIATLQYITLIAIKLKK